MGARSQRVFCIFNDLHRGKFVFQFLGGISTFLWGVLLRGHFWEDFEFRFMFLYFRKRDNFPCRRVKPSEIIEFSKHPSLASCYWIDWRILFIWFSRILDSKHHLYRIIAEIFTSSGELIEPKTPGFGKVWLSNHRAYLFQAREWNDKPTSRIKRGDGGSKYPVHIPSACRPKLLFWLGGFNFRRNFLRGENWLFILYSGRSMFLDKFNFWREGFRGINKFL